MTGGRLSCGRVKQHRAQEMFSVLSPWLLRKLLLFCMFKVSFLARLASRYFLAHTPSISTYLSLYNSCLLSLGKKIYSIFFFLIIFTFFFDIFLVGMWFLFRDLCYCFSESCQQLPELFIWPLFKPSCIIYCIILRDKLLVTDWMDGVCGHKCHTKIQPASLCTLCIQVHKLSL